MAVITTRAGKGTPLTNAEVDANFTNLNTSLAGLQTDINTRLTGAGISSVSGLIKGNSLGAFAAAAAGTDYVAPNVATSFTAQQVPSSGTLTDGTSVAWDADTNGQIVTLTLAGNRTMAAPTNIKQFASYLVRTVQDATGSRTLAWNAAFKFGTTGAPVLTTTANKVDYISFIGGAGNTLICLGARYNAE